MFFRFFLSVHFFFPKSSQFEKQITNLGSQKIFFERKFWRKNQTSRFRVSKRHILHSIPQTMFALSAQSFAVSARCARLISHPISSRRCPIFFFFRLDEILPKGSAFSLPKFFRKKRAKNKAKSRERRFVFSWFPKYFAAQISFRKTHRNPLFPRRNAVVNRKQTSKRASLKVRAEVRPVF